MELLIMRIVSNAGMTGLASGSGIATDRLFIGLVGVKSGFIGDTIVAILRVEMLGD